MTQSEIMDMVVGAAERGKDKARLDGFSERALEVIDLFERWKMFTGGFSLIVPDNIPDPVKDAIGCIRGEIIDKLGLLTEEDMSGNPACPKAETGAPEKREELGAYVDFQGFTPKPEICGDDGDGEDASMETAGEAPREDCGDAEQRERQPLAPKVSAVSPPVQPSEKKELPTIAQLLKSNLDKALAVKNAEFTRDKLLFSFLPVILESIKSGLGINVIYQHVAGAGFAGSADDLVSWLNAKAPAEMAGCMCQTEGCRGVIMKDTVADGYALEMRWICPICGKVHEK